MTTIRIATVVGARPQFIKAERVREEPISVTPRIGALQERLNVVEQVLAANERA
jgi:hypothetical protein